MGLPRPTSSGASPTSSLEAREPGTGAPEGDTRTARLRRLQGRVKVLLVISSLAAVVLAGILAGQYVGAHQSAKSATSGVGPRQLAGELVRGRALVDQGKDGSAFQLFATVLKEDPNQPEALAYEGWLLRLTGVSRHQPGLGRQGLALVRRAVALDPTYPDAHLFLGVILDQDEHDPGDGVAQLRLFLSDKPTTALVRRATPVIDQVFADAHQAAPALP